jgi:hypothetical protein
MVTVSPAEFVVTKTIGGGDAGLVVGGGAGGKIG